MASISSRSSGNAVVGEIFSLEDGNSKVDVSPARGALITSFRVGERELLYLDEATLNDASKSVRGGIPVLFPSPGKLEGDAYAVQGKSFSMKQHGFARNLAWTVSDKSTAGGASLTLALDSSEATLAQYPFEFAALITFSLVPSRLRITFQVESRSAVPMPFGVGYHPYFAVVDKAGARIDTRATRAFDNVTKEIVSFTGFDLTSKEVDLHLLDHGGTSSALHLAGGARVELRGSAEFARWVVWTLAGKPFVCVEPWTCPGNALNTGDGLIRLSPASSHESWVEVALKSDFE